MSTTSELTLYPLFGQHLQIKIITYNLIHLVPEETNISTDRMPWIMGAAEGQRVRDTQ